MDLFHLGKGSFFGIDNFNVVSLCVDFLYNSSLKCVLSIILRLIQN